MSNKPLVLLSNDDGIDAAGLQALRVAFQDQVELFIVAPAYEKSGASHSISLHHDLALQERGKDQFAFDGTPVDCVAFALRNLLDRKPDLILSGINHGANLANDTLYSGTVGAAMAGCAEGIPAIASSLVAQSKKGPHYFDTAVEVVRPFIERIHELEDYRGRVININVPNIPKSELKGVKVCSLGQRVYNQEFLPGRMKGSWKYNFSEPVNFGGSDVDVTEVQNGYATCTVLKPSLYDAEKTDFLKEVVSKI